MSYSNAEIDLSGIHVACLIGVNGAGKSSLLDAITWTLWEEGRARTDELIKLGKDEMSCEIDFYMEENLYKVCRSRNKAMKTSQGKSNLEFQVFNPKDESWKSLSLSATRLTQELIIKTIKMDHETFVNSVYLRQGKADEFTLKGPSQRKQILSDILGLEVYDKLCEAARAKAREIEQGILFEQNLILSLKEKIEKEDEVKENYSNISIKVSESEKELTTLKKLLNESEKELNEKKEKEKQIQALEKSRQNQESLIKILEEQLKNIKTKEEKCKELVENKTEIVKEHSDYLKLKKEVESAEFNKEQFNKLTLEKNYLEQELKEKIKKTEQDLAVYKSKLKDRDNTKAKLDEKLKNEDGFNTFLNRAESEIKTFKELQEYFSKVETEGLELKHEKELLLMEIKKLTDEKEKINKNIKTLHEHSDSESCPLCKSPIKDKEKVVELYNTEITTLENKEESFNKEIQLTENNLQIKRKEHADTKERINSFGKTIISILSELGKIKQEEINIKTLQSANSTETVSYLASMLEVSKNDFQKAREQTLLLDKEINSFQSEINSLNEFLNSGSIIKEITEKINRVKSQTNDLKYSPDLYDGLKKELKEKENIVSKYNQLNNAEVEIVILKKEGADLTVKVSSGKNELKELENLIAENKKHIENINDLTNKVTDLKQKEFEMNIRLNKVKKQLIVTEQIIEDIKNSKQALYEKESKIEKFVSEKSQLETLEKAFSKNGIQVAIIETVVPEIEKEANRILNRLTENQMHIALLTQREKKSSSGLTETLDVVIADNLGTRNYELYSGGEAFKINFALRLALSRLLTNRAGAKLQTLIIDEGFGSQDDAGKERLVEVIKSIQNEFELILVVTHLDELKEAFSTQILVTKDDEGSKVRLVA